MIPSTDNIDFGFKPYNIDHEAQALVLKHRGKKDVLIESHKMRMSVAYGLERFWGEHLRLRNNKDSIDKSVYWKEVWDAVADILLPTGIELPKQKIPQGSNENSPNKTNVATPKPIKSAEKKAKADNMTSNNTPNEGEEISTKIKEVIDQIWKLPLSEQRVAIMVLTQFCDSLVWWTQRYKIPKK
jgi:hypothetical protein